jgi:serine/threonine protein kinase
MSPEQAAGRNIAAPCDIYSLGIIAYEALTGDPPFDGRTLAEVVCMHLTTAPAPLRERCSAPRALCELVERMLDKDPAQRPTAVDVRRLARAISADLAPVYEELEISFGESVVAPIASRNRNVRQAYLVPSGETRVADVDAEVLEFGVTEMLPVVAKPRWTPEFARVPSALTQQGRYSVGPRSARDQVAGEFVAVDKSR